MRALNSHVTHPLRALLPVIFAVYLTTKLAEGARFKSAMVNGPVGVDCAQEPNPSAARVSQPDEDELADEGLPLQDPSSGWFLGTEIDR